MNAPPATRASSAAIQGHGQAWPSAGSEGETGSVAGANPGAGAASVVTSSGVEGVATLSPSGPGLAVAGPDDAAGRDAVRSAWDDGDDWLATLSPPSFGVAEAEGAGAGWAGAVVAVAGRSDGRVTVPWRLKSRSCDGPTVSVDGGGAAVTSTGASLFCATAGVAKASANAAAEPRSAFPKLLPVMRRNAVILPALLLLDEPHLPVPLASADVPPLLTMK
jgi:hypothetical protein